ncbi:MAG: adenylate/guanylate cyclase domain-containing protein [Gammaproteobacteria bacterium]|nr:adenylate/guanylate cyclase domain-containing protein [Phycisphaerae bacterium]NIQ74345.1 adenylate/guanylate cyclase domain-containing protein [Gammaproteobacteria bacterium]
MRFSYRGYILSVLYFIGAAGLFVLIRFVGLASVPAFATFDYDSLNHSSLFARAVAVGWIIGTIFYFVGQALDTPTIRQRPYGALITIQAFSNLICVTLVLIGLSAFDILFEGQAISVSGFKARLLSINFFVILAYYTLVSFAFVMIKQIDHKFGPGNLRKLVAGTFYHPREIEMIVMFLDLKDSTIQAERLGHVQFGSLIQDCFTDMSVVTSFGAQFYQYVGDEAILLWDVADGLENGNCLQAYFEFSHRLQGRSDYYQAQYGVTPRFKAGLNIGFATVLEVGEIKREIAYLGDVLNTASRIQGQCNAYRENLLISEMLNQRLPSVSDRLEIDAIGKTELRGRTEPVQLYRVRERLISDG